MTILSQRVKLLVERALIPFKRPTSEAHYACECNDLLLSVILDSRVRINGFSKENLVRVFEGLVNIRLVLEHL
jgi:hypothetical protein